MPRRKTIGRNPLDRHAEPKTIATDPPPRHTRRKEDAPARTAAAAPMPEASIPPASTALETTATAARSQRLSVSRPASPRNAIGGRLELLGGDLGRGTIHIGRFGETQTIGTYAPPSEQFIDLESQVESIVAWPDQADHRILAAFGWGWSFALLAGPLGAAFGCTLRLLQPRHMIFELRLQDGRSCIGRTDGVTVAGLDAIARNRAAAAA